MKLYPLIEKHCKKDPAIFGRLVPYSIYKFDGKWYYKFDCFGYIRGPFNNAKIANYAAEYTVYKKYIQAKFCYEYRNKFDYRQNIKEALKDFENKRKPKQ